MGILSLVIHKLKSFRMTVPSMILLVLASYRAVTSGYSIQLVGICASVVPFICQFKNYPKAPDGTEPLKDVLSSYIMNLILMVFYLACITLCNIEILHFRGGFSSFCDHTDALLQSFRAHSSPSVGNQIAFRINKICGWNGADAVGNGRVIIHLPFKEIQLQNAHKIQAKQDHDQTRNHIHCRLISVQKTANSSCQDTHGHKTTVKPSTKPEAPASVFRVLRSPPPAK